MIDRGADMSHNRRRRRRRRVAPHDQNRSLVVINISFEAVRFFVLPF